MFIPEIVLQYNQLHRMLALAYWILHDNFTFWSITAIRINLVNTYLLSYMYGLENKFNMMH